MQPRPWARAREPAGVPEAWGRAREYTEITTVSYKNGDCKEAAWRAEFEDSARTDSASPQQEVSRMSAKGDHLRRHDDRWFCLHTMQWLLVSCSRFSHVYKPMPVQVSPFLVGKRYFFKSPSFQIYSAQFYLDLLSKCNNLQIWLVKLCSLVFTAWACEFGHTV